MIAPEETRSSIQASLGWQHPRQFNLEEILEDVETMPNQVYELLTW
jgi:hypothetical protein